MRHPSPLKLKYVSLIIWFGSNFDIEEPLSNIFQNLHKLSCTEIKSLFILNPTNINERLYLLVAVCWFWWKLKH